MQWRRCLQDGPAPRAFWETRFRHGDIRGNDGAGIPRSHGRMTIGRFFRTAERSHSRDSYMPSKE